jgi:AAA domain-containing protein
VRKVSPGVPTSPVLKDADQAGLEKVRSLIRPLSEFKESRPDLFNEAPFGEANADGQSVTELTLLEKLEFSICSAVGLAELEVIPRRKLLGEWFREGDLGFIFAPRGVGKTWFALYAANAIASGSSFGPWKAEQSFPVLYIDGEMPVELIKERLNQSGSTSENLHVLNHEILFERTGGTLNLAGTSAQQAVSDLCEKLGVKVLVLDNLSVLLSGVKENDSDSWEMVLGWLLTLRRKKIAVVIVHHAGRSGKEMRGTSRREDVAFWIVRLEEKADAAEKRHGARFVSIFTKQRNCPAEVPAYDWHIKPLENDGSIIVEWEEAVAEDVVLEWIKDGLDRCEDIAREMDISKGQISKLAKKLHKSRKIRIENRRYFPVTEEQYGR